MKNFLSNYYAIIILAVFIIYNLILKSLKIGGLLYQVFMIILIINNIIILIIFRKNIKYKTLVIISYFSIWLFLKNTLQCILGISSMVTLMIVGFTESYSIKIITTLIKLFFEIFSIPILFFYLLTYGTDINQEVQRSDIYDDMHYYCDNNYEVYSYSKGAMDKFHYSIGKYYDVLKIDDIIYISYNKRNEVTQEKYENYLKRHKCKLVGDVNGSK